MKRDVGRRIGLWLVLGMQQRGALSRAGCMELSASTSTSTGTNTSTGRHRHQHQRQQHAQRINRSSR